MRLSVLIVGLLIICLTIAYQIWRLLFQVKSASNTLRLVQNKGEEGTLENIAIPMIVPNAEITLASPRIATIRKEPERLVNNILVPASYISSIEATTSMAGIRNVQEPYHNSEYSMHIANMWFVATQEAQLTHIPEMSTDLSLDTWFYCIQLPLVLSTYIAGFTTACSLISSSIEATINTFSSLNIWLGSVAGIALISAALSMNDNLNIEEQALAYYTHVSRVLNASSLNESIIL